MGLRENQIFTSPNVRLAKIHARQERVTGVKGAYDLQHTSGQRAEEEWERKT